MSRASIEPTRSPDRTRAIMLIDDRPLVLECTCGSLRAGAQDLQITALPSIQAGLAALQGGARPDLIILSVGTSPVSDRLAKNGVCQLMAALPETPIVIFSDLDEGSEAREALRLGARGYVATTAALEIMIAALRLVLAGAMFVPESVLDRDILSTAGLRDVQGRQILPELTPRETEILLRLREGKPNKIIAHELSLSVGTVQVHVRRVLQKLHATNRSQVAYIISRLTGEMWTMVQGPRRRNEEGA